MLTIHHLNLSRSFRILWLAEELGLPYRVIHHKRQGIRAPQSLRDLHPLGKAPIVEWQGDILAESGAILERLAQNTPLFPESARFWVHHAEGSAMPPRMFGFILSQMERQSPRLIRPLTRRLIQGVRQSYLDPEMAALTSFWDQTLTDGYFVKEGFSIADIAMIYPIAATRPTTGVRADWMARMAARPAYQRALAASGDEKIIF